MLVNLKYPLLISFSGGQSSAMMAHIILQNIDKSRIGEDVFFLFCDTEAEHEKTYQFIKDFESTN